MSLIIDAKSGEVFPDDTDRPPSGFLFDADRLRSAETDVRLAEQEVEAASVLRVCDPWPRQQGIAPRRCCRQ